MESQLTCVAVPLDGQHIWMGALIRPSTWIRPNFGTVFHLSSLAHESLSHVLYSHVEKKGHLPKLTSLKGMGCCFNLP